MPGRLLFASALAGGAAFFLWHLVGFLSPPTLRIIEPPQDFITRAVALQIRAAVEPESRLTINNEVLYGRENHSGLGGAPGPFVEVEVPLLKGENVFVVELENRLGRKRTVVRRVYRF